MDTKKLLIFLADDDQDDRMFFLEAIDEILLETETKTFENGVDLMSELLDKDTPLPDLIFLDLNMPLMSGEECLEDIRNEPELVEIPIIIYSGFIDLDKISMLRKKGATRYLQKPTSFNSLLKLIEQGINSLFESEHGPNYIIKDG
ncbi:response regulator [Arenibacter latericius]|uniref:response regulator n=1 Tax=Arenibacter latericius TaxID=86104 RepID=UPI00055255AF|nr:response regulator [Arenibacter latericius]MDX1364301.1 response regulator [Arenibacter latericius]